jgi:hypothetical protein
MVSVHGFIRSLLLLRDRAMVHDRPLEENP